MRPRLRARRGAATCIRARGADAVDITAVNGIPIAGHEGPGSIADITVRKLLTLQGVVKPRQIVSPMSYPGAANTLATPSARGIHRQLQLAASGGLAHPAGVFDSALTPTSGSS